MEKKFLILLMLLFPGFLRAAEEEKEDSSGASYPQHGLMFSLGLGFAAVSVEGALIRRENMFFSEQFGGYFSTFKQDDRKETFYGPEFDGVFKWPNPSFFTPLVGVGLGFRKWQRIDSDTEFDASSSWMLHYFLGGEFKFHKNFALVIEEKWDFYLGDVPRKYSDHNQHEVRQTPRFIMSFIASL